jgi:hypothetical protein
MQVAKLPKYAGYHGLILTPIPLRDSEQSFATHLQSAQVIE